MSAQVVLDELDVLARPVPELAEPRIWPGRTGRRQWIVAGSLGTATVFAKVALSWPRMGDGFALVLITWATVVSFVVVGLVLLASDLPRANGWACLLVGAATVPGDLNEPAYAQSGLSGVGYVLEFGYLPAAVALVLRYPQSRIPSPGRWLVGLLAAATMVPRIPLLLVTGPLPDGLYRTPGWPSFPAATLHDLVLVRGGHGTAAALLLVAAATLVRRALVSSGLSRQAVIPLATIGAVCAVAAAVDQAIWAVGVDTLRGLPAATVRDLTAASLPVALIAHLARRRAAAGQVADRILAAAHTAEPRALEDSLRRVLLDPSLTVQTDRTVPWPGAPSRSHAALVHGQDGSTLARVTYDPRVVERDGVLDVALAAIRAGLENERLAGEVRRHVEDLRESRARIAAVGWAERRQVERDLHDGAQQRFLAVAATLARVDLVPDTQVRGLVDDARQELRLALAELRRLARGIHPAALSQGGLAAALPGLCASTPIPVDLEIDPLLDAGRLDPTIESAAYFVVVESVTNVVKHTTASLVRIRLRCNGTHLDCRIEDDGPGGAAVEAGGGLAGLRDRVEALDGSLHVHSDPCPEHPDAHGSVVTARLPLRPQ